MRKKNKQKPDWNTYSKALWKSNPEFCEWEYIVDPMGGGTRIRYLLTNYTLPYSTRNGTDGYNYPAPEKEFSDIHIITYKNTHLRHRFSTYKGHPNHNEDWADWILNELLKEKGDNKFRHSVIIVDVQPYMGSDIRWNSKSFVLTKENIDSSNMTDFQKKKLHELRELKLFLKEKGYPGEDEVVDILGLWVYSAARDRNPIFCRESFSMNEHAWDEIGDLL